MLALRAIAPNTFFLPTIMSLRSDAQGPRYRCGSATHDFKCAGCPSRTTVLDSRYDIQALDTTLTAHPGLFVAAKRDTKVRSEHIMADRAGAKSLSDAVGAFRIVGENRIIQSVSSVGRNRNRLFFAIRGNHG
jgi:hypothetical protein